MKLKEIEYTIIAYIDNNRYSTLRQLSKDLKVDICYLHKLCNNLITLGIVEVNKDTRPAEYSLKND